MVKIEIEEDVMYNDSYNDGSAKGYSLPNGTTSRTIKFLGIPIYKKTKATSTNAHTKLEDLEKENKAGIGFKK